MTKQPQPTWERPDLASVPLFTAFGDGTDPDGYVAVADVATAGNSGVGAGAYAAGKFYAAADTIDLEVPATKALDTLKVRVVALVAAIG